MTSFEVINQLNTLFSLLKNILELIDLDKLPHIILLVGLNLNYPSLKRKKESI